MPADIILADFKVEYGRTPDGEILLADEVGTPDECRFWDKTEFKTVSSEALIKMCFEKALVI